MEYPKKVIEHFVNPRNVGEIPDADGIGMIGSKECGDALKVWIKIDNEHLGDIKYKVLGCPAAIACCSMMTELAIGKHVDLAWELTDDQVAEALGGLPEQKYHCSNLAASALHEAIMNYVFKKPAKINKVIITSLMDNTASVGFMSEHGLSLFIKYGNKQILFDTGQSNLLLQNAELLDINLAQTDAIVISHGHYDHTGGLKSVLDIAKKAKIYLHPAALEPKYSKKASGAKSIGMTDSAKRAIQGREIVWTDTNTQIFPGIAVTGSLPRVSKFEDADNTFFLDEKCQEPDLLPDDQAIYFNSSKGLIVILGCAHAGVINTLDYIQNLTDYSSIYAIIGGMHLLNASLERIEHTIEAFRQYDVQKIGLAHCTGSRAVEKFIEVFPDKCFICSAGTQIELGN